MRTNPVKVAARSTFPPHPPQAAVQFQRIDGTSWSHGLAQGWRWGLLLAAFAVVFGVLGLTPSLRWIPEGPLLIAGAAGPILILAVAGWRAGSGSDPAGAGALAGALAGMIGGVAGGLCFVAFGKPVLNVAIGVLAGASGGALVGGIAGRLSRRRPVRP